MINHVEFLGRLRVVKRKKQIKWTGTWTGPRWKPTSICVWKPIPSRKERGLSKSENISRCGHDHRPYDLNEEKRVGAHQKSYWLQRNVERNSLAEENWACKSLKNGRLQGECCANKAEERKNYWWKPLQSEVYRLEFHRSAKKRQKLRPVKVSWRRERSQKVGWLIKFTQQFQFQLKWKQCRSG